MNREFEIFAEAIERPAAERAAFVAAACGGDAALRARVEALLAGHAAATAEFLEAPALVRPPGPVDEQAGDVLGRYTLVRRLGEGGCGVVWLAEQTEPVRRPVALKIIKLGMDTRSVMLRFEAERQALALMDHADIARVFDAGATATGRPFFVMEFVDGVPITKFCDQHSLPLAARLELFARVCVALQHAHQKGIIHRDLKPSNILVTMQDGVPAPKVIDFGIAKATQGRLTEHTLVTGFEQFIGTPAYMSPEQAELRDLDIDTRSDVYSLGVLLYELLTGRPPYDPQSLVRAGIAEIRRIIREVEPPRPSTRVSTLADADRSTVAKLRRAAPTHLTSVLRGDLDWIVMRCLEKDRDRRYGTARELADDVRRHLRREPVVARPPHTLYRLQRFVARHRLACASAAAVVAALVLGTVVSVRQAVRATRAERTAQAERAAAERQREQAEALLTFMLGDFRTELKKLGRLELLDAVGAQATAYFAAIDARGLSDTALARQAKALVQIGETRLEQARYADAEAAFTAALDRATALAARYPANGDMLFERAQAEFWLGFTARQRGEFGAARAWLVRYRDSGAALVALEGKTLRAQRELTSGQHNLAVLDLDRGDPAAARRGFLDERVALEEMIAAAPADTALRYRLADLASWLGRVAEADGRYGDAVDDYREMTARLEALQAQEPAVARWKVRLADSRSFTAYALVRLGRRAEADALYAAAEAGIAALLAEDGTNRQWQGMRANMQLQRAALAIADGAVAAGTGFLAEARSALERLAAAEPTSRIFPTRLAAVWVLEARIRLATGREDALAAAEQAIALAAPVVAGDRADVWISAELAQALLLAGRIERSLGRTEPARARWERALAVLQRWLAARPNDSLVLDPAAQSHVLLGQPALAQPLVGRLRGFGYRPLDPFAASTLDLAR